MREKKKSSKRYMFDIQLHMMTTNVKTVIHLQLSLYF